MITDSELQVLKDNFRIDSKQEADDGSHLALMGMFGEELVRKVLCNFVIFPPWPAKTGQHGNPYALCAVRCRSWREPGEVRHEQ